MHGFDCGFCEKQTQSRIIFGHLPGHVRLEHVLVRRDPDAVIRDDDAAIVLTFYNRNVQTITGRMLDCVQNQIEYNAFERDFLCVNVQFVGQRNRQNNAVSLAVRAQFVGHFADDTTQIQNFRLFRNIVLLVIFAEVRKIFFKVVVFLYDIIRLCDKLGLSQTLFKIRKRAVHPDDRFFHVVTYVKQNFITLGQYCLQIPSLFRHFSSEIGG